MLFNSLTFVVFFALVVGAYWTLRSWEARKNLLLIASYVFYGTWNPPFALLLFATTALDYYLGARIAAAGSERSRRGWLVASLASNLSMLGFFKYGNFLLENFKWLVAQVGINYQPPHLDLFLPIGISFYTFHSLSYTLDVYRRTTEPTKSLRDFTLAVSFFPQLVAGPIVRAADFLPQAAQPPKPDTSRFIWGLALMTLGLFEKTVLADTMLAASAEKVFAYGGPLASLDAWIGVLAFSGQIFFDFAGYSTCAIGAALCLGFHLRDNFRFPYAAVGFSDFWRRWHITLSSWLRDYLYIPLGGNRHGERRTYFALMMTMLLGGLWHGANWTFVVWGGLHGTYLAAERWLRKHFAGYQPGPLTFVMLGLLTYALVNVTWVFFRASTFEKAWVVLKGMFGLNTGTEPILAAAHVIAVATIMSGIVIVHWRMRTRTLESTISAAPAPTIAAVWSVMLFSVIFEQGTGNAFIYFQF